MDLRKSAAGRETAKTCDAVPEARIGLSALIGRVLLRETVLSDGAPRARPILTCGAGSISPELASGGILGIRSRLRGLAH